MTIAIAAGGYSSESSISMQSAEQVYQSLDRDKYRPFIVRVSRDGWYVMDEREIEIPVDKNDFSFRYRGKKITFDCVFIAIHGTPGENGQLQSYFEMINKPYTTCGPLASALTFSKYSSKLIAEKNGVKTSRSVLLHKGAAPDNDKLLDQVGLPCFVKPNSGGSSFGISKVKEREGLQAAIDLAFKQDSEVIVEENVSGREFTCGVFKSGEETILFPPTEIISENEYFDYEAKYEGKSQEITPAHLPAEKIRQMQELSSRVYDLFDCRGVVRVDYIMSGGSFWFLEVNTVPGMSQASIIPQQARAMGLEPGLLYGKVIQDAIRRGQV